jgi:hypothetical protein
VITQQVVLGEGPLIGVELDMDLTDEAGASKVSQLTTFAAELARLAPWRRNCAGRR